MGSYAITDGLEANKGTLICFESMKRYYQVSCIEGSTADLFNLYESKHYIVSIADRSVIFCDGHLETIIGICKKGQFKRTPYFHGGEPHAFVDDGAAIPFSRPLDFFMMPPDQTVIAVCDYLVTGS